MKRYFVSYSHSNKDASGFGNVELGIKTSIKTMDDLNKIKDKIESTVLKNGFKAENVIILHYKRLWF